MRSPRSSLPLLAAAGVLALPTAAASAHGRPGPKPPATSPAPALVARATLPATTYLPGGPSGSALGTTPINGVTPPFPGQPVPGFSGVLTAPGGDVLGLADNGFGSKANSADFLLAVHRVRGRTGGRRGAGAAPWPSARRSPSATPTVASRSR